MLSTTTFFTPVVLCLAFGALYLVVSLVRRYIALRHIPGPRLAAWTDFWLLSKHLQGSDQLRLFSDLEKQYGPAVRYGPNRVIFSNPAAVPIIYSATNVFEKAQSYDVPIVKINGKLTRSLATIRDEKLVSAIKRQIAPAFNANNVHEYEHHIDLTIEAFLDILRTKGPYIDMMPNLSFFSFDTICRLAFSDTMNLMTNQSDVDDVIQGGRTRFQYWHKWFAVPQLEAFLFKNRFSPSSPVPSSLGELARKRVQERLEKGGAGIHDDLLDRVLQAREKDGETFTLPLVAGITVSMIHAGSETTAHSLAQAFWDLLRNPEVYKKLKAEIRAAGLSTPPQLAEVRKIPFVEACLKESSRLHNLAGNPLERTVPPEGATICGTWVPGGTVVSCNAGALAHDKSIYGEDADEYNPERWLQGTAQQHAAMERANFAFSQGKRNCLGIHLAWAEMLKLFPAILNEFDIDLANPNAEQKEVYEWMVYTESLPVMATPVKR